MISLIKSHRDKIRKQAREKALREALSNKLLDFDSTQTEAPAEREDATDYTFIEIEGNLLRVVKEHITIFDVDAPPLEA